RKQAERQGDPAPRPRIHARETKLLPDPSTPTAQRPHAPPAAWPMDPSPAHFRMPARLRRDFHGTLLGLLERNRIEATRVERSRAPRTAIAAAKPTCAAR